MDNILVEIKNDHIQLENMIYDYHTLLKLEDKLNMDVCKEQLVYTSKVNKDICKKHDISTKELNSLVYSSMESLDFNSKVVVDIAKEDLKSVIYTLLEKIKNFIVASYQKIKLFIIKLATTYPVAEKNNVMLIDKITRLKTTKPFAINNRRDLKWVVNKVPMLMAITKDVHTLDVFLNGKNHIEIMNNFVNELDYLHKALLVSPDVNVTGFLDNANNTINNLLKNKTGKTVYDSLETILPEIAAEKSKCSIFRADGSTCKYRVYAEGNYENGIKTIKFSNRSVSMPINIEDKIVITKLFSPDEVIRLLRKNLTYIAGIRQVSNSVTDNIKKCESLIKNIQSSTHEGMKSGAYKVLLGIYMKMNNFIINVLSVETILSNYTTAQNIYYACNKYIEIGFQTNKDVSTESQLPNLPEGVVNGSNTELIRVLDLNDGKERDSIEIKLSNEFTYSKVYQEGETKYNLSQLPNILECLVKYSFITILKDTRGDGILNLFNEYEANGYVNIRTGMENTILDIKYKIKDNIVDTEPYTIEGNVVEYTRDMLLDYLNLDLDNNINNKLYSYLIDYLDKVVIELNRVISAIETSRQIKSNTVVS